MQDTTARPAAVAHSPSFSCVYPGPVDDESVGRLAGPDLGGRETFRLTHTEPTGDGRTRAYFEPVPTRLIDALAEEEAASEAGVERARAHAFWGRR